MPEIHCLPRGPSLAELRARYGSIALIDLSRPDAPYGDLHPARLWRPCPVPGHPGLYALTVEGLWRAHRLTPARGPDTAALLLTRFESLPNLAQESFVFPLPEPDALRQQAQRASVSLAEVLEKIAVPAYENSLDHDLRPRLDELRSLLRHRRLVLLHEDSPAAARLTTALADRIRRGA